MTQRELDLLSRISRDENYTATSKNDREAAKKLVAAGAVLPVRTTFVVDEKVVIRSYKLTTSGMRLLP